MSRTLNKEKPYGTIHHSEDHDGSHFEQDGIIFDANGKEWVAPPPRAATAAVARDDGTFQEAVEDAVAAAMAPVLAKLKLLEDAANGGTSEPPTDKVAPKPVVKPAAVDKNLAG